MYVDRGPNRGRYGDFSEDGPQRGGAGGGGGGGGGFNNRNQREGSFGSRDDRYGNYGRRGNEPRTYNNPTDSKPAVPMHGKYLVNFFYIFFIY